MSAISSLFSVASKSVLITGGSRGIGLMFAKTYAANGANVTIAARSEDVLREAAKELGEVSAANGHECKHTYLVGDSSSREGCEELAAAAGEANGGSLDVLVNNAGAAWGEPFARKSGRMNWGFDKVLDLNVKAPFYLTHACMDLLASPDRAEPGRVINVGSVVGLTPQSAPTHAYDASKAAIHHLTKKMSVDLAERNITCNAIAPGFVPSKMSAQLGTYASFDDIAKQTPLGRLGNEDDMGGAALYLSSKAGAWVTGVILNVDGGAVGGLQIKLADEDE
ncbi:hypothetical protein TeGR_g12137 [Tetraparma gracilis]|uniref:Uncharacterized protein n=1 Tax=Tetraparma gracilis TaxID=2962635 RepID=A0ABQ6M5U7_9STRA|nr:hypothetical protein TeGR_g12137 [Tetraparma gracilis]